MKNYLKIIIAIEKRVRERISRQMREIKPLTIKNSEDIGCIKDKAFYIRDHAT